MTSLSILTFLWQANVCVVCLVGLYMLLFRRLSFFQWNRIYLLCVPLFGLVIASTTIKYERVTFKESKNLHFTLSELFPAVADFESTSKIAKEPDFTADIMSALPELATGIILSIALLFYLKWIFQWFTLKRILNRTSTYFKEQQIFINDRFHTAFAFDKKIYVPTSFLNLDQDDFRKIVAHERAHINLSHHIDNLLVSILTPIFWYNPIFWFLKGELKILHEFQADEACNTDGNQAAYAELLLKLNVPGYPTNFIHPFSKALIKKRVIKLNQSKSSIMKKVLFLATLPLAATLFYAFSIQPIERIIPVDGLSPSIVPLTLPISRSDITSFTPFGMRSHPMNATKKMHTGLDFVAPQGTEIYAANAGVVQVSEFSEDGYGNLIEIAHEDGLNTRYAHLKEIIVRQGQTVKQGELIGFCGSTGKSTGPHLHFEVLRNDTALNPEEYLDISTSEFETKKEAIDKENLVLIIDAAHGGEDAGTKSGGMEEKDVCLDYAKALEAELQARGYAVLMTRTKDEFITLEDRTSITDGAKSNTIFISLHTNDEKSGMASGIELFTPKGSDERSEKSLVLAKHLQTSMNEQNLKTRTIQQAPYWVLSKTNCTAVLVELGFLSSSEDRTNLSNDDYQKELIKSIVQGIDNYAQ